MPLVKFQSSVEGNSIDVDVFLAESPFQRELLARRQREDLDGVAMYLVSPEDQVLLKLIAGRPRDLADIHDVFFSQVDLDQSYVNEWAERLGVADRLSAVTAGPP